MVKGWQKNCIILQKSTHSKAYLSPLLSCMLILEKKTSMACKKSGLSPLRCRSVFAHTHTIRSCLLFCVRLVLLPLSYKLVHQCKHQPCATNGDKIDCQKSKCLPHVLQRRVLAQSLQPCSSLTSFLSLESHI